MTADSTNFNRNIPMSTEKPSVSQPKILQNFQSTNDVVAVDHVGFNQNNAGMHNWMTFPNPFTTTQGAFNSTYPQSQIVPIAFGTTKPTEILQYAATRNDNTSIFRLVPTAQVYGRAQWNGSEWVLLTTTDDLQINITSGSILSNSGLSFTITPTIPFGYTNYSIFTSITMPSTAGVIAAVGGNLLVNQFNINLSSISGGIQPNMICTFMAI